MKLSEFIRESLSEIALGVAEAKEFTRDVISIAPGLLNGEVLIERSLVEFEVAVTAKEAKTSEGSVGLKTGFEVSVIGIKAGLGANGEKTGSSSNDNEKVSKIKFSVPVYMNAHHRKSDDAESVAVAISDLRTKLGKDTG